jgi:hypothetical protein
MNSTIIQWGTYLDSIVDDDLMMDKEKVDGFVAMVEHAKTLYSERGAGGGPGITNAEAKARRR